VSRERRRPVQAQPEDYWIAFLTSQGLVNPAIREEYAAPTTEEIAELPTDPEFVKFLRIASQYGAPKSIEEFTKLPPADRQYYLKAYQIYRTGRRTS